MVVNVPLTSLVLLSGHGMDGEAEEDATFLDGIGRLFDSQPPCLLTLEIFVNLPVYCSLLVYHFAPKLSSLYIYSASLPPLLFETRE